MLLVPFENIKIGSYDSNVLHDWKLAEEWSCISLWFYQFYFIISVFANKWNIRAVLNRSMYLFYYSTQIIEKNQSNTYLRYFSLYREIKNVITSPFHVDFFFLLRQHLNVAWNHFQSNKPHSKWNKCQFSENKKKKWSKENKVLMKLDISKWNSCNVITK